MVDHRSIRDARAELENVPARAGHMHHIPHVEHLARFDVRRDDDGKLLELRFTREDGVPTKARPSRLIEDDQMGWNGLGERLR